MESTWQYSSYFDPGAQTMTQTPSDLVINPQLLAILTTESQRIDEAKRKGLPFNQKLYIQVTFKAIFWGKPLPMHLYVVNE